MIKKLKNLYLMLKQVRLQIMCYIKMDIEDFAERCILDVGSRFTMSVDASLVAEEIARSLEKRGMLKIKGNTIKWKA